MYVPAAFAETDLEKIGRFVDHHPLATVALAIEGRPQVDHLPFMRIQSLAIGSTLIAHVARGNPTAGLAAAGVEAVLAFGGASAYVSPSAYPSKAITHEVVPTWNYVVVHLRGTLRSVEDADDKRRIVESLTQKMEAARPLPWAVTDAPSAYVETMLRGIVGLRFEIHSIEAKVKASQNRSEADRRGVVDELSADPATAEAAGIAAHGLP